MLAAYAAAPNADDPLAALEVGDRPDPEAPDGWVTVDVKAASLNMHDVFTLRGVGIKEEQFPMILGCDGAGMLEDGSRGGDPRRGAVARAGSATRRSTRKRTLLSEKHQGTMAEKVVVPERNVLPKPEGLSFAEAACLGTAWLTAYRMLFVKSGLRPGQTMLVQGASGGVSTALVRAGLGGRHPGVGHGLAPRRSARWPPSSGADADVRVRRAPARARGRGVRDRGRAPPGRTR